MFFFKAKLRSNFTNKYITKLIIATMSSHSWHICVYYVVVQRTPCHCCLHAADDLISVPALPVCKGVLNEWQCLSLSIKLLIIATVYTLNSTCESWEHCSNHGQTVTASEDQLPYLSTIFLTIIGVLQVSGEKDNSELFFPSLCPPMGHSPLINSCQACIFFAILLCLRPPHNYKWLNTKHSCNTVACDKFKSTDDNNRPLKMSK